MEESFYIKVGLGQTDGSVSGTCWRGRRIQDMMTTMMIMMTMVIQMNCEPQTPTTHDPQTRKKNRLCFSLKFTS